MSILYPDDRFIARIGTIGIKNVLLENTNKLEEYAIYIRVPKPSFINSFSYRYDANGEFVTPGNDLTTYLDQTAMIASLKNPSSPHFQYGNKFTLMKYAFPIGSSCIHFAGSPWYSSFNTMSMDAKANIYAVFLDSDGYPVDCTSDNEDGSLTVLYEYFAHANDQGDMVLINTSYESSEIPKLFGLDASGVSGFVVDDVQNPESLINVISGPGNYRMPSGQRVRYNNMLMLSGNAIKAKATPSLPEIDDMGNYYHDDLIWGEDAAPRNIVFKRASGMNIQTMLFAILQDGSTSTCGLPNMMPISRMFLRDGPSRRPVYAFPHPYDPSLGEVDIIDPELNTTPDPQRLCVVNKRIVTDSPDHPDLAHQLFMPPFHGQTSRQMNEDIDNTRMINLFHLHRAMPRATLGERLLQLFSGIGQADEYFPNITASNELVISEIAQEIFDTRKGLSSKYDLSLEPHTTHMKILEALEEFFVLEANRVQFLMDCNNKFDGMFVQSSSPNALNLKDTLANYQDDVALVVFLNISFVVPAAPDINVENWLRNVPMVMQLSSK